MRTYAPFIATVAVVSFGAPAARADDVIELQDEPQYIVEGDLTPSSGVASPRSMQGNWMILPDGVETGLNLRFVTSPSFGVGPLRFTDAVIARAHVRHATAERLELFAGADLLPKQPATMDEAALQSIHMGLRAGITPWLAATARGQAGAQLGQLGYWGAVDAGVAARHAIDPAVTVQGGIHTDVVWLEPDAAPRHWLVESEAVLDVLFATPIYGFSYWFGFRYAVPLASGGGDDGVMTHDPQTRMGFEVGATYAAGPRWDLYLAFTVIDRGDTAMPETTLPVLDGGFDQRQMIFGLTRRFGDETAPSEYLSR